MQSLLSQCKSPGTTCSSTRAQPQAWDTGLGRPESRAIDGWGNKNPHLITFKFLWRNFSALCGRKCSFAALRCAKREESALWFPAQNFLFGISSEIPPQKTILFTLSTFSFWEGCDSAATPGKMKWAIKSNVLQTPQRCVWISCRLSECVGVPVVWKNEGSCSACSCSLW